MADFTLDTFRVRKLRVSPSWPAGLRAALDDVTALSKSPAYGLDGVLEIAVARGWNAALDAAGGIYARADVPLGDSTDSPILPQGRCSCTFKSRDEAERSTVPAGEDWRCTICGLLLGEVPLGARSVRPFRAAEGAEAPAVPAAELPGMIDAAAIDFGVVLDLLAQHAPADDADRAGQALAAGLEKLYAVMEKPTELLQQALQPAAVGADAILALRVCGLDGVEIEFTSPADAITQMATYIRQRREQAHYVDATDEKIEKWPGDLHDALERALDRLHEWARCNRHDDLTHEWFEEVEELVKKAAARGWNAALRAAELLPSPLALRPATSALRYSQRERLDAAHAMVSALNRPRGSEGAREWIMSIPARPQHDPDLVISDGLHVAYDLLGEAERRDKTDEQIAQPVVAASFPSHETGTTGTTPLPDGRYVAWLVCASADAAVRWAIDSQLHPTDRLRLLTDADLLAVARRANTLIHERGLAVQP